MARKKRRRNIPYTNMTKNLFRSKGWMVDDTERKNCWSGTKNDLFGFADLAAAKPGGKPLLIQSTAHNHHTVRREKILGLDTAICALRGGYRIAICSWKKVKGRWVPRLEEITLAAFGLT